MRILAAFTSWLGQTILSEVDPLTAVTAVITGATASAEATSWAMVQPVVRRLPLEHQIDVEQGLGTFGRVMPVLMPATGALGVVHALRRRSLLGVFAVVANMIALVFTLRVNVPVNAETATWDRQRPSEEWNQVRRRWAHAQGVRAPLLLAAFVAICLDITSNG